MNYKIDIQNEKIAIIVSLIIAFAIVGIIDSGYLTYSHYTETLVECSIEGLNGCEDVLDSKYATVFGVPLSLLGVLFYSMVLGFILFYKKTNFDILRKALLIITTVGILVSSFLVYIQLFVLNAICLYCMGSATISTILFILTLVLNILLKNK